MGPWLKKPAAHGVPENYPGALGLRSRKSDFFPTVSKTVYLEKKSFCPYSPLQKLILTPCVMGVFSWTLRGRPAGFGHLSLRPVKATVCCRYFEVTLSVLSFSATDLFLRALI